MKIKKPIGYWSHSRAANIGKEYGYLKANHKYCVIQEFTDCNACTHMVGETWTFLAYSYLPYDDGLQWIVTSDPAEEWMIPLYLAAEEFSKIARAISEYVTEVD